MKKIFIMLVAALMAAATVNAQDVNQATELYNNGAMELQMGNNAAAMEQFKAALAMAETLGDEGIEIADNCKAIIPKIALSTAKDLIMTDDFDNAVTSLNDAIALAKEYTNAEVEEEATTLIPQVYMQKGNTALKAKNMTAAAEAYNQVIALDPKNGNAYLRLGQVLSVTGKIAEAEAAFNNAAANGEEAGAKKQISNMYVKLAAASLKGKKYQEAIDNALKSNEALENATAMKVAGTAASQLKKNADAIKYLKKYLELSPNAKDAGQMNYTIAAIAQTEGDKETAKEYYNKLLNDPKFAATAKQMLDALK